MVAVASGEKGRWALWLPVMLGIGIAAYFGLRNEPPPWAGAGAAGGSIVLAVLLRRHVWLLPVLFGVSFVAIGFAAAQLRSWVVDAPVIERKLGPVAVEGRIVAVEIKGRGSRLTLDRLSIERLSAERTPGRIRLRGWREDAGTLRPGHRVSLLAVLHPPPGPAMPGAFDFSKQAYFLGIGGVGYAVRRPVVLSEEDSGGWRLAVGKLRHSLTQTILASLPGTPGAVAAALITGERGAIPDEVLDAMRDSGLAHLLAISGLHVGLIGGFIFFAVRLGLAVFERFALAFPIKKAAAFAAFAGCLGYLLISGATVPTQRAFVMLSLVLLAVVIDRNAISMNLVAWAAAAILLLAPESLESVSFQMSFAAVIALVAAYEALSSRRINREGGFRLLLKSGRYLGSVLLTTLIASVATAPFAAFHFNRLALLGILANLIAVPLAALWIMPLALVSLLAMPLGLEHWTLAAMGWGIDGVLAVAKWVQGLPGATYMAPAGPGWVLGVIVAGGLWLCLWRGRIRYFGVLPILIAVAGWLATDIPDILVSNDGRTIGIRTERGELVLPFGGRGFTVESWRRTVGLAPDGKGPPVESVPELQCDGQGCILRHKDRTVALVRDVAALEEDCRRADIVISRTGVQRWRCRGPGLVVDRFDIWRYGAHALYLKESGTRRRRVGEDGDRPWQRYPRSRWPDRRQY